MGISCFLGDQEATEGKEAEEKEEEEEKEEINITRKLIKEIRGNQ